uniref:Uncharacterized protein n=1 Tax=Anguilla anguilla TaxID=7936 RepID=A0A0E9W3P3_ANGAN
MHPFHEQCNVTIANMRMHLTSQLASYISDTHI